MFIIYRIAFGLGLIGSSVHYILHKLVNRSSYKMAKHNNIHFY